VVVVIVVSLTSTKSAATAPNKTAIAPVKFVPVMVTAVPPMRGPVLTDKEETVGALVVVLLPEALPKKLTKNPVALALTVNCLGLNLNKSEIARLMVCASIG
jgi:hypothetical protein